MLRFVHKIGRRFVFAFRGIIYALTKDFSFKVQFYCGLLFITLFGYLVHPLSQNEFVWLALSWCLVLITELQNSSFEFALDRIHPELHDSIKKSKDMAAGAVLIAGFFALLVVFIIVFNRT